MARRVQLRGLPFGITDRPAEFIATRAAQHIQGIPELQRIPLISRVLEHAGDSSAAHFMTHMTTELEVVPLLINAIGATPFDEDSAICCSNQVI